MGYLDYTGLSHFYDKLQTVFVESGDVTDFYRQFWSSTNRIEIQLANDEKTYLVWCSGSTSGTAGSLLDPAYGALIIVSNGRYAILNKGTSITVLENSSVLSIISDTNIPMAVVEF